MKKIFFIFQSMYNEDSCHFLNIVIYLPTKNSRNSILFLYLQGGFTP